MAKKKLGEIMLERGIIDVDQLNSALAYQRQWGHRLGVALVAKGFITEGMLAKVLGEVMSLPVVDLAKTEIDPNALRLLSLTTCENNDLIPIALEEGRGKSVLTIAMADPMNLSVIDEIEFTSACKVRPVLATISAIASAIRKHYRGANTVIKPLSYFRDKATGESGRMQLVRPGGEVEEVDTATRESSGPKKVPKASPPKAPEPAVPEPVDAEERVQQIKARRAQLAQARGAAGAPLSPEEAMEDYLSEVQTKELETLAKLEKYFWALMRVMAKKGLITKDEFLREMNK